MRKVIVSLLAWLFFATNAQAQNVSEQQQNIINQQQNQVIQNQKQFEREKELQVELKVCFVCDATCTQGVCCM